MSYISIKGLETSIKEIINLDIQKINAHSDKLAKILSSGLIGSKWRTYRSLNDKSASSHIVSLQSSSENIDHTLQKLKIAKIVCGSRNNRLRISIAHFNNEADINSLINALS